MSRYPAGKSDLTDMVCCKSLLYTVRFLGPPATTSGWTTFSIGYCNSEIQEGVQDGRHNLIFAISETKVCQFINVLVQY